MKSSSFHTRLFWSTRFFQQAQSRQDVDKTQFCARRLKSAQRQVDSNFLLKKWVKAVKTWQYGLWSFQTGDTKLERFLPKNQHIKKFQVGPLYDKRFTLPTADILSGKNARAWVSMVSYLKK